MKPRGQLLLPSGLMLSTALHADDLSVLGYGFVFWPAALAFIFILLILTLFNARSLCRKKTGRAALIRAAITLAFAVAGMIVFPVILEGNRFRQLKAMTLIPVELAGAVVSLIAIWLLTKSWFVLNKIRRKWEVER